MDASPLESKAVEPPPLPRRWQVEFAAQTCGTFSLSLLIAAFPLLLCFLVPLMVCVFGYLFSAWFDACREYGSSQGLILLIVQLLVFTSVIWLGFWLQY